MDYADVWFSEMAGAPEQLFMGSVPTPIAMSIADSLELEFHVIAWIEKI